MSRYTSDAFGFYWTEGRGGLGWAQDAVPTLKGGSTIGIPSPPGIWVPNAEPGRRIVMPSVEDAEALQGFDRGWTAPADEGRRNGPRWKLVGNAVTVGVAEWVGDRLTSPGPYSLADEPWLGDGSWPNAAGVRADTSGGSRPPSTRDSRPIAISPGRWTWKAHNRSPTKAHVGFGDASNRHGSAVILVSGTRLLSTWS